MTHWEWKGMILISAVWFDLLLGEPPNRFHPVAWMGLMIGWLRRICPADHWLISLIWGAGITALGAFTLTVLGVLAQDGSALGWGEKAGVGLKVLGFLINVYLLKTCFGIRSLWKASDSVDDALRISDLPEARNRLAYHLVSRDVQNLDESEISAATIASVAENTSDSVTAPVFFYLLAGIPGALVYRYINTCDAMLGYRTADLQWLGKIPARTDDLLNLIPARVTAALMILSSLPARDRFAGALRIWWTNAGKTESPNAGHPMSAAAGLIGIRLEKAGHYVLGEDLRPPGKQDIALMNSLFRRTIFIAVALACCICFASGKLPQ